VATAERGSSVHFEHIKNFSNSVAHLLRQQKHEPTYLLPKEFRFENKTVFASSTDLQAAFESDQARRTKRAVTEKLCSWWEAVINLPAPTSPISKYHEEMKTRLEEWRVDFESLTGQSVRHIEVHLDEGYLDENKKPVYNAHAHVFACRLSNEKNNAKVLRAGRARLSKLQDVTAEALEMQRGETLASRGGKRGRKHSHHSDFRRAAEELRQQKIANKNEIDELNFTIFNLENELKVHEHFTQQDVKKAQEDAFEDGYRLGHADTQKVAGNDVYGFLRGYLKGTKQAKQSDYQTLKLLHGLNVDLSSLAERAENQGELVFEPLRLLSEVLSNFEPKDQITAAKNVLQYNKSDYDALPSELRVRAQYDNDSDYSPG